MYILENKNHMKAVISEYGATIVELWVPDRSGNLRDVVLGYDDISAYENGEVFLGAVVGRVANRIGGASFELNGKKYDLTSNDGSNCLHSGRDFMNKRIWDVLEKDDSYIKFGLYSPDGDQGYPGAVHITITYSLTEENELKIQYHAVPEEDTLLSLTNHSYFNLNGHASGSVLKHKVQISADAYTRVDSELITTGELISVENTPMDFREWKEIGEQIEEEYEALQIGQGYDHNWVLNGQGLRRVAGMCSEESGIQMDVYTDLPGMQFYTANFLNGESGKEGAIYEKRTAACFETQYFPDAVNKENFESPVVYKGENYHTTTIFKFA